MRIITPTLTRLRPRQRRIFDKGEGSSCYHKYFPSLGGKLWDTLNTVGMLSSCFENTIMVSFRFPPLQRGVRRLSDNSVTDFRLPERAIEVESAPKI